MMKNVTSAIDRRHHT